MEDRITAFLSTGSGDGSGYSSGDGSGYSSGDGSGSGSGDGSGSGSGDGSGYGSGSGSGYGDGSGSGYGDGDGFGYGYGSGSGSGSGSGYGDGSGFGVTQFNRQAVHQIDGQATIIKSVRGSIATGFILQADLTLKPCFVAKQGTFFAHGETAKQATEDAAAKHLEQSPVEDRIALFLAHFTNKKHSAEEFSRWHGTLTGSCRMGREVFCQNHGIKENTMLTVKEFCELTKDQYGAGVIKMLVEQLRQQTTPWEEE